MGFSSNSKPFRLVSEGLDTEIPRVAEAYRNLPWWDSVPILDSITESVLGIKPRRWAIFSYKEFLSKDEASIRTLAEHASIFHDHFAARALFRLVCESSGDGECFYRVLVLYPTYGFQVSL